MVHERIVSSLIRKVTHARDLNVVTRTMIPKVIGVQQGSMLMEIISLVISCTAERGQYVVQVTVFISVHFAASMSIVQAALFSVNFHTILNCLSYFIDNLTKSA